MASKFLSSKANRAMIWTLGVIAVGVAGTFIGVKLAPGCAEGQPCKVQWDGGEATLVISFTDSAEAAVVNDAAVVADKGQTVPTVEVPVSAVSNSNVPEAQ